MKATKDKFGEKVSVLGYFMLCFLVTIPLLIEHTYFMITYIKEHCLHVYGIHSKTDHKSINELKRNVVHSVKDNLAPKLSL